MAEIILRSGLHPVPHDGHTAFRAARRHRMDGAFKAVECVGCAAQRDFKAAVVIVAAGFTLGHGVLLQNGHFARVAAQGV